MGSPIWSAVLAVLLSWAWARPSPAVDPPASGGPAGAASAFALPNGLRVRLVPRHDEKKLAMLLLVRAGFFAEPAGRPHLAHVAEHTLVFAPPAGSAEGRAVQSWFERGKANAETLADFMYFDHQLDPSELDLALRVQAARLAQPEFSRAMLKREVPRALAEIDYIERSEQASTAKMALVVFGQSVFGGKTEALIRAASRAITLDDLREFHRRNFRPDRALLCVLGDFDPAQARTAIERILGPIARPKEPPPKRPPLPAPGVRQVRWDLSTRNLVVAWPTPAPADPDHPALSLAAMLLADKLFNDPQRQKSAKLPSASNENEGVFLVNLQAQPDADLDALRARVLALIKGMAQAQGLIDLQWAMTARAVSQNFQMTDVDAIPLPPNVSKLMALTNIELQKGAKGLIWGDLDRMRNAWGT